MDLTEIMGGDEERAKNKVEQRPDVLLYSNLRRKFDQLVEICGTYDGARALVVKSSRVLRGAQPKKNFDQWVEVFSDKQVALCHLKRMPTMLAIAQPKKKFDEIVQLLGGSEAVSAEVLVLAEVSSSPLRLWNKKALLKRLGASSSE